MSILLSLSNYAIPVIIGYIVLYGFIKKISVYECFIAGVKEGFKIVVDLAPTLVALLVAVGIFRTSGCLDLLCSLFTPITNLLNIPAEIIPVSIIRIFSSSAATGITLDLFKSYGPDSIIGNTASLLMCSTETILYTMSVYFLSIGVTKTRWTLAGALLCLISGTIVSVLIGPLVAL